MSKEMKHIPLSDIRENTAALRSVNRESEKYIGLVESIKEQGVLNAISVRQKDDPETGVEFYELVDGLHRFSASKDAQQETIPCLVLTLTNGQVLEAQIMANIHKVDTRPADYSKQLRRILAMNPLMTEAELAKKLGKSPTWISERLGLNKIADDNISNLINEGKVSLANAYSLAKLPPDEQADFLDRAMTLAPDEFVPTVNARVKEIREAGRQGKDADDAKFEPVAHMQKLTDIKAELVSGEVAKALKVKDPESFKAAVQWCLHLDTISVQAQVAKDQERRSQREEAKKKKALDAAQKKKDKADKAAKEAAKAAEEAKALTS